MVCESLRDDSWLAERNLCSNRLQHNLEQLQTKPHYYKDISKDVALSHIPLSVTLLNRVHFSYYQFSDVNETGTKVIPACKKKLLHLLRFLYFSAFSPYVVLFL